MKWNATNVSAACLAVGLGGFVIGKVSHSGGGGTSEADELLNRSRQISSDGSVSGRETADGRKGSSSRSPRAASSRADSTFDERLASMEDIIRGENALDRGRAMLSWIDSLAPSEFEAAVDRFRNLGLTEARMGEYAMLLTAWAQIDPTAALAYTTEKTNGGMATGTVLTAWASRDPEAAVAWAKANHEGDNPNPYMIGIIRGLVETNPTRATQLLEELPYSGERGNALQAMMPHLLQLGSEGAKDWIAKLSDDRLKDGATARFAEAMAKQDPAGTATWLLANLGEASTRSVDEVFTEWAKTDKNAAMSSFEKLPEGDARSRALRGLVMVDARENPQAAAALMNQYPNDVDDRMVQHFIWNSFDKSPQTAVSQIGLIKDERSRDRMYDRALDGWLNEDPAAARAWVSSANLSENVLKNFQKKVQP